MKIIGTNSGGGGVNVPYFTIISGQGGWQATCDKTFAECLAIVNKHGAIKGDGTGINLPYESIRLLVILDRAGVFPF